MLLKDDPTGASRKWKTPRLLRSLVRTRRRIAFLLAFVILAFVVAGGAFAIGALAYKFGLSASIDSLLKQPSIALMVERIKPTFFVLQGVVQENVRIPGNYLSSLTAVPERFHLDIKHQDFQRLAHIRDRAIVRRQLEKSDRTFVPARIRHRDKTLDVKVRLKGDNIDHLHGEKWSYRVKISGDEALMGMKTFSIQHPKTRNYIYEWLFHRALEREGVVNLRYKFVNVIVNGTDMGTYALEEHFEKRLLENNERREGPILKFNEDVAWLTGTVSTNTPYAYMTSPIDVFGKQRLLENPGLHAQYRKAVSLLEAFRQGQLKTSDVFDVDKLARYYALTELMGADHGNAFINLRFYYNPVTSRLEPVGFDANAGKAPVRTSRAALWDPLRLSKDSGSSTLRLFEEQLFADFEFYRAYMAHLERVLEPEYLNDFFREVDPELEENLAILYREFPYFHYDRDLFHRNQQTLRDSIYPERGLNAWTNRVDEGDFIELEISNVLDVPLQIERLELTRPGEDDEPDKVSRLEPEKAIVAQPIPFGEVYPGSDLFRFEIPPGLDWKEDRSNQLEVVYRFLGTQRILRENVQPGPRIEEGLSSDLTRQTPNPEDFDFIEIDSQKQTLRFAPGRHLIARDLVLPSGYSAIAGPGVALHLTGGASFLSYAALQFTGTRDQPIEITADGGKGQGLLVVKPTATSNLKHVRFKGLSAPERRQWGLTGAVTFYGTKVLLDSCEFLDNDSEDALNFINSQFEVTDSVFRKTRSDAVDSDFSDGTIARTVFSEIGNDAVDVSGSELTMNDVTMSSFGDKGLSAGENSHVNGRNMQILGGAVAIASKDASSIRIDGLLIKGTNVGFTAYRKKPEFGHASIFARSVVIEGVDVPHLIEKRSALELNGEEIIADKVDVENLMYGSVYGKASK